jgi:hypothetical protein|tara:strand:+ start:212 stop:709 length:498 start_codon:yes stop_codon:yes gene_type:complete
MRTHWAIYTSESDEAALDKQGYLLGIRYVRDEPIQWLSVLPKKVWHLWASDMSGISWSTQSTQRSIGSGSIKIMRAVAQLYWAVLVVLVSCMMLIKPPWRFEKSYPGVLLWMMIVYWTVFHAMFFGSGRFHFPLTPVLAIIAVETACYLWNWGSGPRRRFNLSGM